jgi:hypothetical protein
MSRSSRPAKRFVGRRSRQHVAANHDLIDGGLAHLLKNRLERAKISVNVVESRNALG